MRWIDTVRAWARRLKGDVATLWFAQKHPDAPWLARALAIVAVAYALSPIDLIPDAIPVLGLLDDLVLLPVLIWLAVALLPPHVLDDARAQARQWLQTARRPAAGRMATAVAVVLIVGTWLLCLLWVVGWWSARQN